MGIVPKLPPGYTGTQEINSIGDIAKITRSDIMYVVTGRIDVKDRSIEIPAGGLTFEGHSYDLSGFYSSEPDFTLFTSPIGGSGGVRFKSMYVSISGSGSQVYDLTGATGFEAIEVNDFNYIDCTSLGEIRGYRQGLEVSTGRIGGTPELTLSGSWAGFRVSTSITLQIDNIASLFKAGPDLEFSGRFITDMNCTLNTNGAFLDFSPTNFQNDETLVIDGATISRNGIYDAGDTTICPNINERSVKTLWSRNTGLPNTRKYIKASITAQSITTILAVDTYYPIAGTFTVDPEDESHFQTPVNGQYELLSGQGVFNVIGELVIEGTAGGEIDIRAVRSTDGGVTWSQIEHIKREINNLSGPTDRAFFPINFLADMSKGDRLRLEVENKTSILNVTAEVDSYLIISG